MSSIVPTTIWIVPHAATRGDVFTFGCAQHRSSRGRDLHESEQDVGDLYLAIGINQEGARSLVTGGDF